MEIVELTAFEEEYVKGIDGLMRELSATAEATEERVRMVIERDDYSNKTFINLNNKEKP